MDRPQDQLGALLRWSQEVAALTLAFAQILFGAILIYTVCYALYSRESEPMIRMFELTAFITCLRILVAPPPEA